MPSKHPPIAPPLESFNVDLTQSSVSGLSSGAFMAVQFHLAHSSHIVGAGIVAGGPFRCAESFLGAAPKAQDAAILGSLFIGMQPLTKRTAPNPERLSKLAVQNSAEGKIDPLDNLKDDRLYIFTGSKDSVVDSKVVATTRAFYEALGVPSGNIAYDDTVAAGHSLITTNPEDNALDENFPPYINRGDFIQSHRILTQIYGSSVKPAAEQATGRVMRFDQSEFFGNHPRASMSRYGYAYIPKAVDEGEKARVHIALHGCKQGYNYINYVNGKLDRKNSVPYGNRYITTTGYNEMADSNNLIILYPQAEGRDDGYTQNPNGCWDWWGYTSENASQLDYYSKNAIQIQAIYKMLCRLGEGHPLTRAPQAAASASPARTSGVSASTTVKGK